MSQREDPEPAYVPAAVAGAPTPGLAADTALVLDRELASACWLRAVYLFGSRARGRARPDIDIGVLVEPSSPELPPSPLDRAEFVLDWAATLSSRLGLTVDVVDLQRAGVVLVHQVLSTGRKLLEQDCARTRDYEARALMAYFDFLPVERTLARAAMASIRNRARW